MGSERHELSLGTPASIPLTTRAAERLPALSRPTAVPRPARARVQAVLRPAFAVVGLGMLVLLVRDVGAGELRRVLSRAAPWLPLVFALEVARLSLDALATWVAYGSRAQQVPFRSMLRAQLISTVVATLAPAGRVAGEATKAALVSPYTGGATAMAAAATSQAAALVSTGLISIPCALAAYVMTGPSWLTLALGVHMVVLVLVGASMRAGMRAHRLGAWLKRRFHRIAPHTEVFQESARSCALLPARPILATLLGRVLQVVQYGILAMAVGIDVTVVGALVAQGLNLVALAVGTLVPGQFGVSDGAFALSAKAFGTTAAKAMSIALIAHVIQVLFVLMGALTPLVWRERRTPAPNRT
ncbi:flippase-like domain-containing protein [Archangium violaceum]|uniref:lysylphosphatidylglycerol synthase transmembrane domain-containing protein n=1 Tax=Archangium violaceum TaxID=83451 RepID=UPI00194E71FA|nr:lysylphosphatidylglycerol synthase transmembrane domain-containing protein [Archangium violaceum]QRN96477.1 flippase-like domain-containing protein [Archangium violaceum]